MQTDHANFKKISRDIYHDILRDNICDTYINFVIFAGKKYNIECLNHHDKVYLSNLDRDKRMLSRKFILEIGF